MTSSRLTRCRILAFAIGMLLVLIPLALVGRVESRGPACSQGLGRPVYLTYAGARYGWPLTAVQIGHTACQGSPGTWTPQLFVAWHIDGLLLSGVQLLAGGLLALIISNRAVKKHLR